MVARTGVRTQQERDAGNTSFGELLTGLSTNGELVGSGALGDPEYARLYRRRGGQVVATDGPYSETKEHFAGFMVIEVDAAQATARWPWPSRTVLMPR